MRRALDRSSSCEGGDRGPRIALTRRIEPITFQQERDGPRSDNRPRPPLSQRIASTDITEFLLPRGQEHRPPSRSLDIIHNTYHDINYITSKIYKWAADQLADLIPILG